MLRGAGVVLRLTPRSYGHTIARGGEHVVATMIRCPYFFVLSLWLTRCDSE